MFATTVRSSLRPLPDYSFRPAHSRVNRLTCLRIGLPQRCRTGPNKPVLRSSREVCSVYRVASPQGTATVALIRFDCSKLKMNFKLRRSKQHCRVNIRWYGGPQGRKYTIETDTPSEHAPIIGSVVMGECLWFENPIACLFEQIVMPETLFFW